MDCELALKAFVEKILGINSRSTALAGSLRYLGTRIFYTCTVLVVREEYES